MDELIPITRHEYYLAKLGGQDVAIPTPVTREEFFLAKACGEDYEAPTPVTRYEMLLDNLSGGDHDITPVTRLEHLIAKAAGKEAAEFDPVTRDEVFWSNAHGGGSDPLNTFTGAIVRFLAKRAKPIVKLEANFTPIQSGTGDPSPENIRPISGHTGCDVWDDPKYGRTINWNQMFDGTGQRTSDGITTEYDSENNAIKITNNSRTSNYSSGSTRASVIDSTELVTDHKYYCKLYPDITGLIIVYSNSNTPLNGTIFAYNSTTWISLRVTKDYDFVTAHPVGDVTEVQLNFFDLTEMFGAGNEPTTVEEFEALFPKDYYESQVTPIETCVSAVNGDPYVKVSISFGQTVYGGTLTVNEDGSGSIKARPYYSSYNGEALVGPWVSSMDAYVPGATPTTGAQVVDMGGTETTTQLTASQINTLVGENNVWVDAATGDITVQAYGTPVGAFSPIVGAGQAGHMII